MNLELNEDWRVRSIPENLVLEQRYMAKDKDGNDKGYEWTWRGYYPTLRTLFDGLVRHNVLISDINGLSELVDALNELEKTIARVAEAWKEKSNE